VSAQPGVRLIAALAALAIAATGCAGNGGQHPAPSPAATLSAARSAGAVAPGQNSQANATTPRSSAATPRPSATTPILGGPPSDRRHFVKVTRITGSITPKSVDASKSGLVVAQNMIYTHTLTVYDTAHRLVTTIPDRIVPADYGYPQWTKPVRGGPVEASFSPDGKDVWVSNYSMYGPGFSHPGDDVCSPRAGIDRSFLYRIDTTTLKIDKVALVGSVPKYVNATPDGRSVLVTNWCSWELSLVDTTQVKQIASVYLGRYPRGIAVSPDSRTAYVAVMGSSDLAVVNLERLRAGKPAGEVLRWFRNVGQGPRHVNISPDGATLYVTLNAEGRVAKVDARTGTVLTKVSTGQAPRSSVLSPDGTALFVVNYESGTVTRLRTSDLAVLESAHVDHHPIGITYNPVTQEIWVASYGGSIAVFKDAA